MKLHILSRVVITWKEFGETHPVRSIALDGYVKGKPRLDVAAKAIVYASLHDRREIYVGMPTVEAIIGNKLFPGLLDQYLAHTCYEGQQTDEPEDPNRPYNLYEPVAGDHGAHGRFDDRARNFSPQLWTDLHRDILAAFALVGVAALGAALFVRRNN